MKAKMPMTANFCESSSFADTKMDGLGLAISIASSLDNGGWEYNGGESEMERYGCTRGHVDGWLKPDTDRANELSINAVEAELSTFMVIQRRKRLFWEDEEKRERGRRGGIEPSIWPTLVAKAPDLLPHHTFNQHTYKRWWYIDSRNGGLAPIDGN
jgi:hypothetical protein